MSARSIRSSSPSERRAILALTRVAEVGSITHQQLIARFGSASRALDEAFPPDVSRAAYAEADALCARGEGAGLALTTIADATYPASLHSLYDPPPVFWSRGEWATLRSPVVAIVGTRRATPYGQRVAREIAGALARAGACIVSGMALGIDGTAHRAALDAGAPTVAVLGTGADIAYPRAHTALHREIGAHGLILSELPPGSKSGPGSFPRRNRIIAALASLTIVIEAPMKSGALITSRDALEMGRDVGAVPGPIDVPQSQGTNELIRDGAHAVTCAADAVRLAGLEVLPKTVPELRGDAEARVWAALQRESLTLDELCARTTLPVSECLSTVTALELRGIVECLLTGAVARRV